MCESIMLVNFKTGPSTDMLRKSISTDRSTTDIARGRSFEAHTYTVQTILVESTHAKSLNKQNTETKVI